MELVRDKYSSTLIVGRCRAVEISFVFWCKWLNVASPAPCGRWQNECVQWTCQCSSLGREWGKRSRMLLRHETCSCPQTTATTNLHMHMSALMCHRVKRFPEIKKKKSMVLQHHVHVCPNVQDSLTMQSAGSFTQNLHGSSVSAKIWQYDFLTTIKT